MCYKPSKEPRSGKIINVSNSPSLPLLPTPRESCAFYRKHMDIDNYNKLL